MARITKTTPERHQEILEAACSLFVENGYDKTQIADIAQKLNVAQGLIYHYFNSKKELLYSVIDEMVMEKNRMLEDKLKNSSGTAYEKLEIILRYRFDSLCFGKLIPSILEDAATFAYYSNRMTESANSVLLTLIDQGNQDGSWNCLYPKEAAMFILKGFQGACDILRSKNGNENVAVLLKFVTQLLGESTENNT